MAKFLLVNERTAKQRNLITNILLSQRHIGGKADNMKEKIINWLNESDPYYGVTNKDGIEVFIAGIIIFTISIYLHIHL